MSKINKTGVAMCLAMLMLAGCKQPAEASEEANAAAAPVADVAPEMDADGAQEAADMQNAGDAKQHGAIKHDAMAVGIAMAAGVELCHLQSATETQAGKDKMKAKAVAEGMSAVEFDQIYAAALQQAKARAAEDPQRAARSCEMMRKLGDPAEVKKLEDATKALEKLANQMEAGAQ